jgi:hippurate hydrolase
MSAGNTPSKALDTIREYHAELTEIRRDFHAHPELGMEEHRTAERVAQMLQGWGIEVHRGVGGTGVVGVLRSGNGHQAVGLRADMDALPIEEANAVPYRSLNAGRMHACGHDGHTTMLLGAARYLAETREFNGVVNFIFQPGEEGMGGALAMLKDGLFERFPCDAIYGMHNRPGAAVGHFSITPGMAMAGGSFFDITIAGKGAHGARPSEAIDPVLAADMAVLSVTQIRSGDAYNVIPQTATMAGTVRAMKRETMTLIETALRRVVSGVAAGMGATAEVDVRLIFAPLPNDDQAVHDIADAAAELVGESWVDRHKPPAPASEDFSFMLEKVPGAYINLGNGENSASVHNERYDFNDEIIPLGAALYARIVERKLARDL